MSKLNNVRKTTIFIYKHTFLVIIGLLFILIPFFLAAGLASITFAVNYDNTFMSYLFATISVILLIITAYVSAILNIILKFKTKRNSTNKSRIEKELEIISKELNTL